LKLFKSKPAAKKELMRAFEKAREIPVPQHILALEKELQEVYSVANVAVEEEYELEKRARLEA
jgi:hypothetical protein